jgi:hypothetical protein
VLSGFDGGCKAISNRKSEFAFGSDEPEFPDLIFDVPGVTLHKRCKRRLIVLAYHFGIINSLNGYFVGVTLASALEANSQFTGIKIKKNITD